MGLSKNRKEKSALEGESLGWQIVEKEEISQKQRKSTVLSAVSLFSTFDQERASGPVEHCIVRITIRLVKQRGRGSSARSCRTWTGMERSGRRAGAWGWREHKVAHRSKEQQNWPAAGWRAVGDARDSGQASLTILAA